MDKILETRARLWAKLEELRNKIDVLDRAISLMNEEPKSFRDDVRLPDLMPLTRRVDLKGEILRFLAEAGSDGLNANMFLSLAEARGQIFDRNSVATILSRMKREGRIVYDGRNYRLKAFATLIREESQDSQEFEQELECA